MNPTGHCVECRPWGALAQRAQELLSPSPPVRELVAKPPTPRCDHREDELPAVVQELSVHPRVVLAHCLGNVGEVELDGSMAAGLEVNEQRAAVRAEHVAWMRLAVQQLLLGPVVVDRSAQASEPAAEQHAVCVGELRREIRVGSDLFRLRDSIREPGTRQLNRAHAGVQPLESARRSQRLRPEVSRARSRSTASRRSRRACTRAGPREAPQRPPGTRPRRAVERDPLRAVHPLAPT